MGSLLELIRSNVLRFIHIIKYYSSDFLEILPEALETDCAKCSDKQRLAAQNVVTYLMVNKPQIWNLLANTYDPNGKYRQKYAEEWLKNSEIVS